MNKGEPTKMQVGAIITFLERGMAINPKEDLMEDVEFQLQNELFSNSTPLRVKAEVVAMLINQLDADLEGFGECSDEHRRSKARIFLESSEGQQWIAKHTATYSPPVEQTASTAALFVDLARKGRVSDAKLLDNIPATEPRRQDMLLVNHDCPTPKSPLMGPHLDTPVAPETMLQSVNLGPTVNAAPVSHEPLVGAGPTVLEPEPYHMARQASQSRRSYGMTPRWLIPFPHPGAYVHGSIPNQPSIFDHEARVHRQHNGRHTLNEDLPMVLLLILVTLALVLILSVGLSK
ncbi:hypothetical protein FB567DRAFT_526633 [Paraphoma chrysanthemicola]|uniref:Uncharacterized protein n=1 Tax=Paraphoma chrysanthemicola TaxID=798071 RepID=A0A8K0VXQ6_9PLEO|nr:hypothetical protein FB567DRAFT_526633 [Paraphoma chrysanthemicola]